MKQTALNLLTVCIKKTTQTTDNKTNFILSLHGLSKYCQLVRDWYRWWTMFLSEGRSTHLQRGLGDDSNVVLYTNIDLKLRNKQTFTK